MRSSPRAAVPGQSTLGGVDVPLRDRPLRVARLELHVGLGVARGRLVGERRVAEVMPGAERLLDLRSAEGRAHVAAGELGRVERRAERGVAEDEGVVGAVAALLPLLL